MGPGLPPAIAVDLANARCVIIFPAYLAHTRMPECIRRLAGVADCREMVLDFSATREVDLTAWAGLLLLQRLFGEQYRIRVRGASPRVEEHCNVLGIGRPAHPLQLFALYLLPVSRPARFGLLLSLLSVSAVAAAQWISG